MYGTYCKCKSVSAPLDNCNLFQASRQKPWSIYSKPSFLKPLKHITSVYSLIVLFQCPKVDIKILYSNFYDFWMFYHFTCWWLDVGWQEIRMQQVVSMLLQTFTTNLQLISSDSSLKVNDAKEVSLVTSSHKKCLKSWEVDFISSIHFKAEPIKKCLLFMMKQNNSLFEKQLFVVKI